MKKTVRGWMVWLFWFGVAIVVPSLPMYVVYLRLRHDHNKTPTFAEVLSAGDLVLIAMVLPLSALGEALPEIVKHRRGLGPAFTRSCRQLWREFREVLGLLWAARSSNGTGFAQRYVQMWTQYRSMSRNYSNAMDLAFLPLLALAAILIAIASGGVYVQFLDEPKPTTASVAIYVIAAALAVQLHQLAGKLGSLVAVDSEAQQGTDAAEGGVVGATEDATVEVTAPSHAPD